MLNHHILSLHHGYEMYPGQNEEIKLADWPGYALYPA